MKLNPQSVILLIIIAALATFAVIVMIRRKKRGNGCCGDCSNCPNGSGCAKARRNNGGK